MEIAVLLSGGVDSSVALCLLKKKGYQIRAFYLKIWLEDELSFLGNCPWEDDILICKKVCKQYDIPFEIISLQKEYYEKIIAFTIDELKAGRTPSPDIFCNSFIKFGIFFDKISSNYFEKIASGHYASILEKDNIFYLKKSIDLFKDQTYFLSGLNQQQLSKLIFPIGSYIKSQIRQIAMKNSLVNSNRKDSQGICFLGKIKYNEFISFHLGTKKGKIIEKETGKIYGEHNGYWFHTIGQRKGISLGNGPWYVVQKDIENNIIFISHKKNFQNFNTSKILADKFHWTLPKKNINKLLEITKNVFLEAKIRHGEKVNYCCVEDINSKNLNITLLEPDNGIAQGQYIVLYKNKFCLGNGMVS